VKHFALHRFQSVTLLYGETLNQPVNFDIDALLAQGWGDFQDAIAEKIIKLQCWCEKGLKDHLVEMPLTQKQWIDFAKPVNGRYLLTVKLPYTWQLYQWLLSQGSRLQVVEPEWLRDKMCQEVRGMLENYD
jgi:predicted DNA-binding transcriptional regulator YafY